MKDIDYGNYDDEQDLKSQGEIQIGRLLRRSGIAYRYEQPVAVVDREKTRIWYPDFYLPEYGMIIEYFGMTGKSGYHEQAQHKQEVYRQNGIDGLFLPQDCFRGSWPCRILGQIHTVLERRLNTFERIYDHRS